MFTVSIPHGGLFQQPVRYAERRTKSPGDFATAKTDPTGYDISAVAASEMSETLESTIIQSPRLPLLGSLERDAKKWMPGFRENPAVSKILERDAIRPYRISL